MFKEFFKPFFWAVGLHGGVLGILLLSWPFLAQSVFSFDRSRVLRVSLVSPLFLSQPLANGPREKVRENPEKKMGPPVSHLFQGRTKPDNKENRPLLQSTPSSASEVIKDKKEHGTGPSLSAQASRSETEKEPGGPGLAGGKGKELAVSFPSAGGSSSGSIMAVPRYGQNRRPYYPESAREQGWQGTAWLKVLVLKNGSVGSLEILRSSGYAILDRSALKAVKEWIFVPAQKDGQSIETGVEVPVTFRLE